MKAPAQLSERQAVDKNIKRKKVSTPAKERTVKVSAPAKERTVTHKMEASTKVADRLNIPDSSISWTKTRDAEKNMAKEMRVAILEGCVCRVSDLDADVTESELTEASGCNSAHVELINNRRSSTLVFGTAEDAQRCSAKGCLLLQGRKYPIMIQYINRFLKMHACVIHDLQMEVTEKRLKESFGCESADIVRRVDNSISAVYLIFATSYGARELSLRISNMKTVDEYWRAKTCVVKGLTCNEQNAFTLRQDILTASGCISVEMEHGSHGSSNAVLLFDSDEAADNFAARKVLVINGTTYNITVPVGQPGHSCFVHDLDDDVTEDDLRDLPGYTSVTIFRGSGGSRFAVVDFETRDAAVAVSKKGFTLINGREFGVEMMNTENLPSCIFKLSDLQVSREELIETSGCISSNVYERKGVQFIRLKFETADEAKECYARTDLVQPFVIDRSGVSQTQTSRSNKKAKGQGKRKRAVKPHTVKPRAVKPRLAERNRGRLLGDTKEIILAVAKPV